MVSIALVIAGVLTAALAIYLGSEIDSSLYSLAAVSIGDFALAWAFSAGKIGPLAKHRRAEREGQTTGDAAAAAEANPSYNPYAREG